MESLHFGLSNFFGLFWCFSGQLQGKHAENDVFPAALLACLIMACWLACLDFLIFLVFSGALKGLLWEKLCFSSCFWAALWDALMLACMMHACVVHVCCVCMSCVHVVCACRVHIMHVYTRVYTCVYVYVRYNLEARTRQFPKIIIFWMSIFHFNWP